MCAINCQKLKEIMHAVCERNIVPTSVNVLMLYIDD